jgi:hypothetical protein
MTGSGVKLVRFQKEVLLVWEFSFCPLEETLINKKSNKGTNLKVFISIFYPESGHFLLAGNMALI